LVEYTFKTR